MLSTNPFSAAVQAKRVLLEMYPAVKAEVVLGPQGPFIRVLGDQRVPARINGFRVRYS